jgi:hypothetical protein
MRARSSGAATSPRTRNDAFILGRRLNDLSSFWGPRQEGADLALPGDESGEGLAVVSGFTHRVAPFWRASQTELAAQTPERHDRLNVCHASSICLWIYRSIRDLLPRHDRCICRRNTLTSALSKEA